MTKRGYVEIDGVQDPVNGPPHKTVAHVHVADFNQTAKFSPFKAELMRAAQDVLRKPAAIYVAKRNVREEEVVGYCYVGMPSQIPNGKGGMMNLPAGRVVAVYVDKALNVWEWGLEVTGDDPPRPNEPEARFGKRLF